MSIRRFLVDLSMLPRGTTGVGVYAIHMARHLERSFRCRVLAPPYWCAQFNDPIECPPPLAWRNTLFGRDPSARFWRRELGLRSDDLLYAPHMRGHWGFDNQIVTIHDLIHHHYPTRNFVNNAYNRHVLPAVVRRARAVFTVSQTAKRELCDFYGLDPRRVDVVPNGIDLQNWRPAPSAQPSRPPYLLTVSANRPYKNTLELLEQRSLWADRYRLVIVSWRSRYGRALHRAVMNLGLQDRVDFLDGLPEHELIALYRGCSALVYPSLLEGFGRPPLEAMAVGRPVILSDIPVHRETFGEAGIFVTPGQPESWARAFAALDDPPRVADHIERGLRLAQRYSWQSCGQRLTDALLQVEPALDALRVGT
ncbi:glycosyltransferase family 1 protein [Fontimonas sp. SYSU GA230001]|uniref:glycosyltransferase family 4 protein n=1 Tax=Fontimonas sp. SYSU GA230001 TaxID=3142450 RepID=UPI0032B439BA